MNIVWSNLAPRVGVAWDPRGDGRTSVRAGYGLTGDFVTGQFFFDSRSAPPFGLEQRLTNTRLDDPWGAVGRVNPYPVPLGGDDYPYSAALYSLFISMPTDIKTTRNHAWNVALQRQVGDNMAFSATYMGNRMTNMWGVVDGNPGVIPPGAAATGPCTLRLPTGGTQIVRELLDGTSGSPPRVEPGESASRAVLTGTSTGSLMRAGRTITACCCRFSVVPPAVSRPTPTTRSPPAKG